MAPCPLTEHRWCCGRGEASHFIWYRERISHREHRLFEHWSGQQPPRVSSRVGLLPLPVLGMHGTKIVRPLPIVMFNRLRGCLVGLFAAATFSMACAGRVAPPALGPVDQPRASWSIRAGSEYGAEREVCRSDRDTMCVIQASSEKQPTSVVVSVYLFPVASEQTTYKGAFLASFMGSAGRRHEMQVDYTIKPGQNPSFVSSAGRVTSTPGDYDFQMALFAEVPGHADPYQFQQQIPVRVSAPASSRTD